MIILRDILEFNAPLGGKKPYCYRWVINFGLFSIRLHHWIASDLHDHTHPYWMFIFCFAGGYRDESPDGIDEVQSPAIRFRPPGHRHRVLTDGAWTFLVTGPKVHRWYLFRNGKRYNPRSYFEKYGT